MTEKPRVELDWTLHWCTEHREPFRARWPEGGVIAMVRLFEATVADPRIAAYAGGKVAELEAVLGEFAPLCCFIDPGELARIYAEAGVEAEAVG